jgi:hypothetical protein
MKMFITLITFLVTSSVFADCTTAYQNQIKTLEGRMNPPRAALISNVIAEGAVVTTLMAVGTMPVTAIVALPAVALGSATYYGILISERNGLRNGLHLIRDAHRGKGKTIDRLMSKLNHRNEEKFNRDDVINFIIQNDFDNKFCEQDEIKDTYYLKSFRKILKMVKSEFADS